MGDVVVKRSSEPAAVTARQFETLKAYRIVRHPEGRSDVTAGDIVVMLPGKHAMGLFNAGAKTLIEDHAGSWDRIWGVRDRSVVEISICFDKG